MILGIDHIGVQVRDLARTVAAYEAIFGRSANWRGGAAGWRHAWFQFDNAALDIVAPEGDSEGANAIRADIEKHGEGIWGLGFAVADMAAAVALFGRRGLDFLPAHTTMTEDGAGHERRWNITMMKRASGNGVALFLVERQAPRWPVSEAQFDVASIGNLDHVVVQTTDAERAVALYGGRLGLDLRLDRSNAQWGVRQLFFRTGGAVVEIGASLKPAAEPKKDRFGGLAWRVKDVAAAQARIAAAGIDVSEVRKGRKPGTAVCTVRAGTGGVPTLLLSGNE
ncbi:MAG: VOC family protein [Proteobacteria bacterium]|nr:VOC family protein [Pseudomonadota bacterium]